MKKIAILMGSETDRETVMSAVPYFDYFGLEWELRILSAHRNPEEVTQFSQTARQNGFGVIIGTAGMAAHLAGAIKAHTTLPVIGVPLAGGILDGMDALLSTVQMPKGVPVATFAVGKTGIINAVIFAAEIFALSDDSLALKLKQFKAAGCTI